MTIEKPMDGPDEMLAYLIRVAVRLRKLVDHARAHGGFVRPKRLQHVENAFARMLKRLEKHVELDEGLVQTGKEMRWKDFKQTESNPAADIYVRLVCAAWAENIERAAVRMREKTRNAKKEFGDKQ